MRVRFELGYERLEYRISSHFCYENSHPEKEKKQKANGDCIKRQTVA